MLAGMGGFGTGTADLIVATIIVQLIRRAQSSRLEVMLRNPRRFLVMLVSFTIVGGSTAQFARSAEYGMAAGGIPCNLMMSAQTADGQAKTMAPCKTMIADCLMQLGCVVDTALPAKSASLDVVARHHISVVYWAAWSNLAGLAREPEPLPPRTT